jgi:Helix-turn-helix of DDE superfamily endonuclease
MLTYAKLKDNPRRFLAVTSVKLDELEHLLPIFAEAYAAKQSRTHTQAGSPRQRQVGGGRKARLASVEDKLLFILMYHKTYPLQTTHGLQFGLSQAQTNEWVHRLMPILNAALARLGYVPERDPAAFAHSGTPAERPLAMQLDGTERRRQRPKDPQKQREHYSGKKNPHGQEPDPGR